MKHMVERPQHVQTDGVNLRLRDDCKQWQDAVTVKNSATEQRRGALIIKSDPA